MSHQTKRPFDSVECSTPHDLLIRCSLSNLQFPAIVLTWCGLTSHRHRSIEPFFMSLAARDYAGSLHKVAAIARHRFHGSPPLVGLRRGITAVTPVSTISLGFDLVLFRQDDSG